MAGCTHHIYKSVNCVYYCQICGARIDPPAPAKPAEQPAEAATQGTEKKPRRTRKAKAD